MRRLNTWKVLRHGACLVLSGTLLLLATATWGKEEPPPQNPGNAAGQPQETPPAGEEEFEFLPAPEPAIPQEYLDGRGYLGNFPDAWAMERLSDPVNARVFLALQNGAGKETLAGLEIPDVDLSLDDLISGRMVRESSGTFRPAFPLIREGNAKTFADAVESVATQVYSSLRPALEKIRKEAAEEKLLPWLYTLVWSELLESRRAEDTLAEKGALGAQRLRDEGYLWILIPANPYATGEDRYSSGSETLHYLSSLPSPIHPFLQDYVTRRRLLDAALAGTPWEDESTRETLQELGILDSEKRVRVPVLRNNSHLLKAVRKASRAYVKDFLRRMKADSLASSLGATRDEIFAPAFACTGYRILQMAIRDGLFSRPEYLSSADAPMSGIVETLLVAENERLEPLERAYYLYDREDFEGAVRQADAFLQKHPGDSEALFRKGISLMKLRKYPEALQVFQQAAVRPAGKGDVWRAWILIRTGNVLDMMQRREEATRMYSEALGYADVSGSRDTARNWLENVYQD